MLSRVLSFLAAAAPCDRPARVFADGHAVARRCADTAAAAGLTVLDLDDAWTPYPFAGAAIAAGAEPPAFRDSLVALAGGYFETDPLAATDAYLELYGVSPAPQVVLAAMSDAARHRCRDAGDDAALAALDPGQARRVEQVQRAATRAAALAAVQGHLICDGLLAHEHSARSSPATATGAIASTIITRCGSPRSSSATARTSSVVPSPSPPIGASAAPAGPGRPPREPRLSLRADPAGAAARRAPGSARDVTRGPSRRARGGPSA